MKKLILLLLIGLIQLHAFGINQLMFHKIDVRSGLSDNYVKSIIRDKYGFMWMATSNGIDRYDGYQLKKYTVTQLGSYNNDTNYIIEDAEGTIWVRTVQKLYTYDRCLDKIADDATQKLSALGIKEPIKEIMTDDAQNLWTISTKYLYRYDFKKQELTTIPHQFGDNILSLTARGNQAYILTNDGRFYQVDILQHCLNYVSQIKLSTNLWHQVYLDSRGALWFYTAHSASDELRCYISATKEWKDIPSLHLLKNVILTTLTDDEKGRIWIGTENEGIYLLNAHSQELQQITRNEEYPFTLPSNHISCFYRDAQNLMWIGTSKRGAAFTDLSPHVFDLTPLKNNEDVSCVSEDKQGNIWVGFDGNGIVCLSPNGTKTVYNKKNALLDNNLVTCSLIDHNGHLWVGTYGDGVFCFDGHRFAKKQYHNQINKRAVYMRCMAEDEQNNLWFGTINNGLICLRQDGSDSWITMDNSDLRTTSITALHCDRKRKLYIGTSTGFYIYQTDLRKFLKPTPCIQQLTNEFVTTLDKDKHGLVWIGTRTGIRIYDEKNDTLYSLTENEGLSNNYIRAIIADNKQNIWASTDHGLTYIRTLKKANAPYEFVCTPFYDEDGLENATFNNDATCLTTDGCCVIGYTDGLLRIGSQQQITNYLQAHIVFTNLAVNNKNIVPGDESGILQRNLQLQESICLNYSQNSFSIDVSAMNYGKKHKLHYMYRLKEVGGPWTLLPGNRISFNAITPGSYTLEVCASDMGGWTSEPSAIKIRIQPPFWRSWYAYLLYLLLIMAGIYFYIQWLKRKHQATLALQKLEMELEQQQQMEDKKMQFFTNISHDLKTPLSLIITPLEKLLSGNLEKSIRVELDLVWRNARMLMDEVVQLLDIRKLDAGNEEIHPAHGDLIIFVRKICEQFRFYAESRGIQMNFKINASHLEMDFDQAKMRRIVMNLLSNAFKYNTTKGRVDILIERDGPMARIEVADTGIGIKDKDKPHIFDRFFQGDNHTDYVGSGVGLHIVKEYVTMHHGQIQVADNHPKGSVFIVTIPIQTSLSASGTASAISNDSNTKKAIEDTGNKSVLVVEDNHDFCQFLERCLTDQYNVFTASNGVEALQILSENDIHIVISDIMMPEMDGLELCHHIKNDINLSHIPVILLTAKSTEDNIITGLRDGADDYITKPFNLNILKLRIEKMIKWTDNNHREFIKRDIAPSEITVSSLDEQLITKAIQVVEDNMSNSDFSVEDFSAAVGMTRSHLYKKLMAITGKSPLEFIRVIRIKRGRSLLEQGRTNISEVAYTIGFSPKQFSKYFKEEYGYLPSEFLLRHN